MGQQEGIYSLYRLNGLVLNPADAGTIDGISVSLINKRQWVGFPGAPSGQTFSCHGPLGKSTIKHKIGLGFHATSDRFGPNRRNGIYGSASYKFPLGKKMLSLGFRAGLQSYAIKWSQIEYFSGINPQIGNKAGISLPEFALGMRYYSDKSYMGFSIGELTQPALDLSKSDISYGNIYRTFMFTCGYDFKINKKLIITPSLLIKQTQNNHSDLLLNMDLLMDDRFWMGLGIRSNYEGGSIMLGTIINKRIKVAYSYSTAAIMGMSLGGSHEIMFGFDLWNKKSDVTLQFISEDGIIIMTSPMSKENYFFFDQLPAETSFLFKLKSDDPGLIEMMNEIQIAYKNKEGDEMSLSIQKDDDKLFRYSYLPIKEEQKLFAINGVKDTIATATKNSEGYFVFQYLPNDPGILFLIANDVDGDEELVILINGKDRTLKKGEGSYFKFVPLPAEQVKLHLIGDNGDTLGTGYLNSDGFFVFESLPIKQSYLFLLESQDAGMIDEIQILALDDKENEKVLTMTKGEGKYFRYKYLDNETSILYLIGENGDTISSTTRNMDGYFVFENLPSNHSYLFKLKGQKVELIDDLLILLKDDKGGEEIISAEKIQNNLFRYTLLPHNQMSKPGLLAYDEAPLILNNNDEQIIKKTSESLKFNTGEAIIRLDSYIYLEELSQMLIANSDWRIILLGYTDNVGDDKFNLRLSKERSETVKRALVKRKVLPSMIRVKYYGETNPVASNDTEEGRQKNRRVEMKVVKVIQK